MFLLLCYCRRHHQKYSKKVRRKNILLVTLFDCYMNQEAQKKIKVKYHTVSFHSVHHLFFKAGVFFVWSSTSWRWLFTINYFHTFPVSRLTESKKRNRWVTERWVSYTIPISGVYYCLCDKKKVEKNEKKKIANCLCQRKKYCLKINKNSLCIKKKKWTTIQTKK